MLAEHARIGREDEAPDESDNRDGENGRGKEDAPDERRAFARAIQREREQQ